ncbi:MAG TPA: hypothetical protein PKE26_15685 [Kiritimatiellia bacterium]|nr:hypothetical protein [Kiritimatiellia bacterium]HMP00537.1 hypothetical protein [Kiritimatiellia bacterium]
MELAHFDAYLKFPPDDFPEPLTENFTVYANNAIIATVPWPPASDFDCW